MENKAWLWRKKSAEKVIVSGDRFSSPLKGYEEQVEAYHSGRAESETDFKDLNDKLSSALPSFDNKDDLVKKHEKMAQEAISARAKAESELMSLRKKLDECLKQRAADEERLAHLDSAHRDCTQQLHFVREEQEKRIHDAVMKVTREFEKSRLALEERLEETTKRLAKTALENNHLSKSLLSKETLVEDLTKQREQVESELSAVMSRLDSMERNNASLKYEIRVLEKELDIRNEEREFSRRTSEVSQKQHLESAKKVARLEAECQRLRLLVRKRLPGPATLTRMRNEAEMLTRDPSTKRIGDLTEQLTSMEEENRALKEALERKSNELQVSRNMYARAASKLSQVVPIRNANNLCHAPSLALESDMWSDDKASCAESWASVLVSELDNFRNEKLKESTMSAKSRASELDLMEDFVEMERIAVFSTDEPSQDCLSNFSGLTEVVNSPLPLKGDLEEKTDPADSLIRELPEWLQDIAQLVVKQSQVNGRDPKEVVEDIKAVMESECKNYLYPSTLGDLKETMKKSISKIAELLEGITLSSSNNMNCNSSAILPEKDGTFSSSKTSDIPTGYTVQVFQWKTSELRNVLQEFLHTCYDLLSEKADFCKFGQELAFALEWILNHCFSIQDVSSMREELAKRLDCDDPRSDGEADAGPAHQDFEPDKSVARVAQTAASANGELKEGEASNKEQRRTVESLRSEIESLKESRRVVEDQIESQRTINQDFDRQLPAARVELSKARKRSSSVEVELENKSSCCEELENTCPDPQLQPESVTQSKILKDETGREDTPLRTDLEITAASEKLAECQETILNLGKQLKALASQEEEATIDKVIPATANDANLPKKSSGHRPSLLDQMLAEDKAKAKAKANGDEMEVINDNPEFVPDNPKELPEKFQVSDGVGSRGGGGGGDWKAGSLAIVPLKKQGAGGFLRKLLWRKRKVGSKKASLPHAL